MQPAESIEIKILLSIQAASNYNPRKANKTAAHYRLLWAITAIESDARYQNSEHGESEARSVTRGAPAH